MQVARWVQGDLWQVVCVLEVLEQAVSALVAAADRSLSSASQDVILSEVAGVVAPAIAVSAHLSHRP